MGLSRTEMAKYGVNIWSGSGEHLGERPGIRNECPYMSSKGKIRRGSLGKARSLNRVRGRSFTQLSEVPVTA